MKTELSPSQIGQRIAELRKSKGLSQEYLAKSISISRSSLTQIELGNRSLNIIELQKLSHQLEFSLDDFMSPDFGVNQDILEESSAPYGVPDERIAIPSLKVDKFKNVLLYILEKCAGKPNVGETVLYKLLYFSDFNYYELYEEQMTGALYKKLPYGPVPQKLNGIISQMIEDKLLLRVNTEYHGYPQLRYLPLEKPNLHELKASETDVIDKVLDQMSDWSASMISNYSHNDKPWKVTENNGEISYELAFYRTPPYSVRIYDEDEESIF